MVHCQRGQRVMTMSSDSRQTVHVQIWAQPTKSPGPWKNDLASMCLNFLMCKIRIIITATSQNGYEFYINVYMEHTCNCAWHIISVT